MVNTQPIAGDRAAAPSVLGRLYSPIRAELDEVEQLLRAQLTSAYPFVDQLAKHGFRLGGKRMRPALVLLSARAAGEVRPAHISAAAMVELIHTATLIHDDVLDEAQVRRHVETVNASWGNETSVLLGDLLFARALGLLAALDQYATRAIGQAAQTVCEGELRQIGSRGDFDLSEDEYFSIIADKTAALTACCCELGAYYAGAPAETCRSLWQFGHDLGVAFQIADDLLDLLGDEAQVGKSLGTDLAKQKPTLPLIRLLAQADAPARAEMIATLGRSGNHRQETFRALLNGSDAVAYARQKAQQYVERAKAALVGLKADAVAALGGLAEFSVNRQQ